MANTNMQLCLWFHDEAEEAARFYSGLFHDSEMGEVQRAPADNPSMNEGAVMLANFTLVGMPAMALNGRDKEAGFSDAVSLQVYTESQEQTDRYWDALTADGGGEMACSWCYDRFGMRWQITPRALMEGLAHDDPAVRERVYVAMMDMIKIDHAKIEAAIRGEA